MVCTFKTLSLVEDRHKVQVPVIDDNERSAVSTHRNTLWKHREMGLNSNLVVVGGWSVR